MYSETTIHKKHLQTLAPAGPRLRLPWLLPTHHHSPASCLETPRVEPLILVCIGPQERPRPPPRAPRPLDSSSLGSLGGDVTLPREHPPLPYFSPRLSSPCEILRVFLMDMSAFCLPHPERELQAGGGVPALTAVPCRSPRPGRRAQTAVEQMNQ